MVLTDEGLVGDRLIILLDEPGLSLHGRAQIDLLRYINEQLIPSYQVIYTTHSPFMIDLENLLKVRTVEDVVAEDGGYLGTKVGDEVLSTDSDTLFPLRAALGYDISQSLFVGEHNLVVEGPSDLLYLRWASNELRNLGRVSLDPRWTIAPAGGIDKVSSFVALFGGGELHVAVFADYRRGDKAKVERLRESELLQLGHVFSADVYAELDEADTEDVLGRDLYVALVNSCYRLPKSKRVPTSKPDDAKDLVTDEVKAHFRTLSPTDPEYDHYAPAVHLTEHWSELSETLPGVADALDRMERLFRDLNELLP